MLPKNLLFIILLGIILLASGGCAAVALVGVGGGAGAGTIAYLRGELESMEDAPLERTYQAAQKAVKDLGFIVTSEQKDAFSAKLVARSATDKRVEVNLKELTDKLTEVSIRVGTFGDEALSRLILEYLKKHL